MVTNFFFCISGRGVLSVVIAILSCYFSLNSFIDDLLALRFMQGGGEMNGVGHSRDEPRKPPSRAINAEKLLEVPFSTKIVRIAISATHGVRGMGVVLVNVIFHRGLPSDDQKELPPCQKHHGTGNGEGKNEGEDYRGTSCFIRPRFVGVYRECEGVETHGRSINTSCEQINQKEDEVMMVVETHTIANPRTVMVHPGNACVANMAVMNSISFALFAILAKSCIEA